MTEVEMAVVRDPVVAVAPDSVRSSQPSSLSHTTTALPCGRAGTCFSKTCGLADDTEGHCRPWFRPVARDCHLGTYSVSSSFLILHTSHPIPSPTLRFHLPAHSPSLQSISLHRGTLCFLLYHRPLPRRAAIARLSTLSSSLLPLGFSFPAITSRPPLASPQCARQKDVDLAGF
jgi:hypothetical protein